MPDSAVAAAAERLRIAAEAGEPCEPIRDLIPESDLGGAYEVQRVNTQLAVAAGRRIVGRKIGLTNPAVQAQLGVDQPDFGTLFAEMAFTDGAEVPWTGLIQPRIEAEVALVLGADLDHSTHTVVDVINATAYALPALEIVDSRIREWDIRITDTIADNGSSARFVLGTKPVPLEAVDLRSVQMTMSLNEKEVSSGSGAACLGNPLNAACWLADVLSQSGDPLGKGDIVLTGALGPMVAVAPGDSVEAAITGLGTCSASFADPDRLRAASES